ncbi:hypothetical protein H8F21_15370 [Pseudomonas sp. P66]|uniref:Uncharacterized protein n=1 Tax=Pseudomonas arcuscaelestis TaxID=2710591 RepID=A0ABS2C133_9PSED|nr:hypothetical protein [Pseudomonas arcuscaelestis]MBM5458946.1 hypothetical protein [Pseudomonas arcuscaelestis]
MSIQNFRGDVVLFVALANDLITAWEAGRLAATQQGAFADNPFKPDTRDHDEWARGFTYGIKDGSSVAAACMAGLVVTPFPVMEAKCISERPFWAEANRFQQTYGVPDCTLAVHMGITEDELRAGMVRHHFWDADGIPLGIREAS